MCFGAESRPKHIPAIEMKMTLYYKRPDKVHIEAEQGVAMFPRGSLFGNPLEGFGRYQAIDGKYYLPVQMNAELHPQAGSDAGKVIKSTIRFSNYRINKGISDKVFESNLSTPDRGPHLGRRYRK